MRVLGFILAAAIGFALLQAAAKLALVLVIFATLVLFVARPAESAGCVAAFLLLGVVERHPFAGAVGLVALILMARTGTRRTASAVA